MAYELHAGRDSSHRILADFVRHYGKEPVLDVGAAHGYVGQLLAQDHLAIDGIEPHLEFAAAARPFYRQLFATTVEDAPLDKTYGTIVCGDVLEHLVDPLATLRRLTAHLQPGGVVLVSLPNVAHLAVRLLLLSGRFPYMDRGPLDRTHLHFYTRATAQSLLEEAGLRVIERRPTIVPLADIAPPSLKTVGAALEPLQRWPVRLAPGLFAYQWVFAARFYGRAAATD